MASGNHGLHFLKQPSALASNTFYSKKAFVYSGAHPADSSTFGCIAASEN